MLGQNKVLLQVSLPKWFRLFYGIVAPITLLLFFIVWFQYSRDGFTFSEVWKSLLLLTIVGLGLWITPIFYSTIVVTEAGLELKGVLGSKQEFSWDEIVKVSRPRFRIPKDTAYVFSETGKKIILSRSMTGYTELLKLIESRAPNLSPKKLPPELWT